MENNVTGNVSVESIADEIGISPSQLFAVFKKYTAMTPHQYFIHIKILRAETMLEEKNATVKSVALSMGFEDQYNFSRIFTHQTGVRPSKWREHIYGK
jgi:transcriptional regulator GlxA family with amidase domain